MAHTKTVNDDQYYGGISSLSENKDRDLMIGLPERRFETRNRKKLRKRVKEKSSIHDQTK